MDMELKDFVRSALRDIVTAVIEARADLKDAGEGAVIAPRLHSGPLHVAEEDGHGMAFPIEFDLIVAVTNGKEGKLSAGGEAKGPFLSVLSFSAKLEASGSASNQRVTTQRIKFTVPVRYPQSAQKPPEPRQERAKGRGRV